MVFSSPLFLFAFLPGIVLGYFLCPRAAKNAFLLAGSLVFYLLGAGAYTLILIATIGLNFFICIKMNGLEGPARKAALVASIAVNLAPLAILKYAGFAVEILNQAIGWSGAAMLPMPQFFLPAGISFFAFQGSAYAIDVYRGQIEPCRSLVNYSLFISFFPQLVAGPIVRYHLLAPALRERSHSLASIEQGLIRFGFGLGKKILLADTLGRVADSIFGLGGAGISTGVAWLGVICYTFQIFFDFSGYSDMAIGLGGVFGLPLPENFLQPYRATSVTDFWRRWHVTLSTWFRDYLYFPLGGSRRGTARTALNLGVVFLLCGLWHGAAYTYVVWGLYHGLLLSIERVLARWNIAMPGGIVGRFRTVLLVMIGWVFFRAASLSDAWVLLQSMVGVGNDPDPLFPVTYYLTTNHVVILLAATIVALWPRTPTPFSRIAPLRPAAALGVTALSVIAQAPQSFNPFIYFQF